jgi:hypothetical protein
MGRYEFLNRKANNNIPEKITDRLVYWLELTIDHNRVV